MFPCIIHTEVNAKREDIATIGYDGVRVNRSSFYYHKKMTRLTIVMTVCISCIR